MVGATNALGLGMDMPNIRAVIQVDGPRSIRDFGQESGRAGRDGQASESIIMVAGTEHANARVAQCVQGQTCCRVMLDGYLDGREDRKQCEAHEEACYVCQPLYHEPERGPSVDEAVARVEFEAQARQRSHLQAWVRRIRSDEAFTVDEFQRTLETWAGRCPWCYSNGHVGARTEHALEQCPAPDVGDVQGATEELKKGIRYEKYCVCYGCGIPQAICDGFERKDDGGWAWRRKRACQYPGLMVGAVISMMTADMNHSGEMIGEWMRLEGIDERHSQQVFAWMGRKIQRGGIEAAVINKVFYYLAMATG